MIVCSARVVRINVARQAHRFFDFAAVFLVLPDQQIGDSARVVEIASHKPSRYDWDVFAVEPRPGTKEVLVPSAGLSSLLSHRLIPVIILSCKVPLRGRVFKESVKVRTPKSPSSTDDTTFDLSAVHIFAHSSRIETQRFRRLTQRQESIPNRGNRIFLFPLRGHWTLPLFSACFPPVLRRRTWAQNGRKTLAFWAQIGGWPVSKGSRINVNFADLWSGRWESNPRPKLEKLAI
jgi:hypothetical protein